MLIKELIQKVDVLGVMEELTISFPYETDRIEYLKNGFKNLSAIPVNDGLKKDVTLYSGGISSRPTLVYVGDELVAITFDWMEIPSLNIVEENFEKYTPEYIMCVLLLDICFFDNTVEGCNLAYKNLVETLDECKSNPGSTYLKADDVFADIRDIIGDVPDTPVVGEKYKNINGEVFEVVFIGDDVIRDRTMIALKGADGIVSLWTEDDMLRNISSVNFCNGVKHKYRFERVC